MTKRGFKASVPLDTPPPAKVASAITLIPSWKLLLQSPMTFWQNFVPASVIVIVPVLLVQLGAMMVDGFDSIDSWTIVGLLIELGGGLLLLCNLAVSPYMQVHSLRGDLPGIWTMYRRSLRFWLRLAGFGILFSFLFAGGLILLIVPGLKALRRYILAPYFIIEDDSGIRQAMQRSSAASWPTRRAIWSTIIILLAFSGVGYAATKLPNPWSQAASLILSVLCFYMLALRYQDVRRTVGLGLVSASVRR